MFGNKKAQHVCTAKLTVDYQEGREQQMMSIEGCHGGMVEVFKHLLDATDRVPEIKEAFQEAITERMLEKVGMTPDQIVEELFSEVKQAKKGN